MSVNYEEIVRGESFLRHGPGERHERICERLYTHVSRCATKVANTRVLPTRTVIELCPGTLLRPDLTLVTAATGKACLIAEFVDTIDHHPDTVMKKAIYEDARL